MVSLAQQRARNIQLGTLLKAVDIFESSHTLIVDSPVVLEETLLDRMLRRVAFTTVPRAGNLPDVFEFVVGRDVYYALTALDEFRKHMGVYPELYVKCGTTIFYKGLPVTTDAMFEPGHWMLAPNSILCLGTRTNGSTVLRRPLPVHIETPKELVEETPLMAGMRW